MDEQEKDGYCEYCGNYTVVYYAPNSNSWLCENDYYDARKGLL